MMCLTTKKKFMCEPDVIVLRNNRFAYHAKCPWKGKNEKELYAFKFCSRKAYEDWLKSKEVDEENDAEAN